MAEIISANRLGAFSGMTPTQVRLILINAHRIARRKSDPAWALAMELFGVGSTVARNLCVFAGIDPMERVSVSRCAAEPRS